MLTGICFKLGSNISACSANSTVRQTATDETLLLGPEGSKHPSQYREIVLVLRSRRRTHIAHVCVMLQSLKHKSMANMFHNFSCFTSEDHSCQLYTSQWNPRFVKFNSAMWTRRKKSTQLYAILFMSVFMYSTATGKLCRQYGDWWQPLSPTW